MAVGGSLTKLGLSGSSSKNPNVGNTVSVSFLEIKDSRISKQIGDLRPSSTYSEWSQMERPNSQILFRSTLKLWSASEYVYCHQMDGRLTGSRPHPPGTLKVTTCDVDSSFLMTLLIRSRSAFVAALSPALMQWSRSACTRGDAYSSLADAAGRPR